MTPLFILYSILISSIFVFLLGFWVWLKDKKSILNIIFLLLSIDSAGLFFGSYMMLSNCGVSDAKVVFWDRFLYIFVVFIPVLVNHFSLALTGRTKKQRKILYLGYIISSFFLILSQTDYFIKDVFHYQWGCHTIAQTGHHIFLVFFMFYAFLFFYNLIQAILKEKDVLKTTQIKYVLVAIFFTF